METRPRWCILFSPFRERFKKTDTFPMKSKPLNFFYLCFELSVVPAQHAKLSWQHALFRSHHSGDTDCQVHGNVLTAASKIHFEFQKFSLYNNTKDKISTSIAILSGVYFVPYPTKIWKTLVFFAKVCGRHLKYQFCYWQNWSDFYP